MKPPTNQDLLNELHLQRKLLFQINARLVGLSVFVVQAGKGDLSAEKAMQIVNDTTRQLCAQMSEYDLDLRDMT